MRVKKRGPRRSRRPSDGSSAGDVLRRHAPRRSIARRPDAELRRGEAELTNGIQIAPPYSGRVKNTCDFSTLVKLLSNSGGRGAEGFSRPRLKILAFAREIARAVSSVGERFLDTEEVTCSIHVPPTIFALILQRVSTPSEGSLHFGWANGWAKVPGLPYVSTAGAEKRAASAARERERLLVTATGSLRRRIHAWTR